MKQKFYKSKTFDDVSPDEASRKTLIIFTTCLLTVKPGNFDDLNLVIGLCAVFAATTAKSLARRLSQNRLQIEIIQIFNH